MKEVLISLLRKLFNDRDYLVYMPSLWDSVVNDDFVIPFDCLDYFYDYDNPSGLREGNLKCAEFDKLVAPYRQGNVLRRETLDFVVD